MVVKVRNARAEGGMLGCSSDPALRVSSPAPAHLVIGALAPRRATVRKTRRNLFWAVGYNTVAFPIAAGLLYPALGLLLRPEIAALSLAGSSRCWWRPTPCC